MTMHAPVMQACLHKPGLPPTAAGPSAGDRERTSRRIRRERVCDAFVLDGAVLEQQKRADRADFGIVRKPALPAARSNPVFRGRRRN